MENYDTTLVQNLSEPLKLLTMFYNESESEILKIGILTKDSKKSPTSISGRWIAFFVKKNWKKDIPMIQFLYKISKRND